MQRKYDMNLTDIVSLGIGSIVGAGIFALLGQVVLLSGNLAYLAFVISGVAALFSGYSYAKLAGAYPNSGGLTDYFHLAFKSPWIANGLTFIYVLTSAISISMMAKSFGIYASEFFDGLPPSPLWVNVFGGVLIVSLGVVNMLGAGDVGKIETLLVALKIGILVVLIAAAYFSSDEAYHFAKDSPHKLDFWRSIGITFFAYAGYGVITNASADVKNPAKTIAWGIFLTLAAVMALYLALTHVVLHYIPQNIFDKSPDTAIALVARQILGKTGYVLVSMAAFIAFITGTNATYFSIFRINKFLAEHGAMPKIYLVKFWQHGTYGNLLTISIILAATFLFDFSSIVNLSSAAFLVSYLGIFAADWKLRQTTKSSPWIILCGALLLIMIFIGFIIHFQITNSF